MGYPGVNQYSGYGATNSGQMLGVNAGLGAAPAQTGAMMTGNAAQPGAGQIQHSVETDPTHNAVTLIIFIWNNSFLCLEETFVPDFIKGDTTEVPRDPEDEEMASLEAKPYVIWNNGGGICRLVHLSQLKKAITDPPLKVHAIQVPAKLLNETMFNGIFGQQNVIAGSAHHVVGGLDSNSRGSNYLEVTINEAWKQFQRQYPQLARMDAHAQAQLNG